MKLSCSIIAGTAKNLDFGLLLRLAFPFTARVLNPFFAFITPCISSRIVRLDSRMKPDSLSAAQTIEDVATYKCRLLRAMNVAGDCVVVRHDGQCSPLIPAKFYFVLPYLASQLNSPAKPRQHFLKLANQGLPGRLPQRQTFARAQGPKLGLCKKGPVSKVAVSGPVAYLKM